MSNVFLIEITNPDVARHRVMIEAKGEVSAGKAYLERVATIRKLTAAEALKFASEKVPLLNGATEA